MQQTTRITQRVATSQCLELLVLLRAVTVAGSVFVSSLSPTSTFAGSFRIFDQSASGTAQGGAFAAQADDPSAIYYNPAGLSQLPGIQTSFGTLLIGGHTTYTGPAGGTAHGDFGGSVAVPPPTTLYFSANLKDLGFTALGDLSAGLGVVSPFGILYRYPDDAPFATAVTRQSLPLIDIKPTLAYKLTDQLSVGIGADIYTFASFWGSGGAVTKFSSSGGPGLPPPGTRMELNGGDTAAGFNVSLLYSPFRNGDGKPLVNVAVIYRSQATLHLNGNLLANGGVVADASTTLVLPQVFTGGISVWPIRDHDHEWKLELDVDMTGWKSVRNTDVRLSNGTTIPFAQDWRNSYTTMIGTEFKWLKPAALPAWEVALRGGYWHSQTPIPDRSFLPTVPDADQHAISVGLGFLCKANGRFLGLIECGNVEKGMLKPKAIGLDLAYQAIFYEGRTVSGNLNPVAIPGVVNGTYQTNLHVGMINLRVNF